MHQDEIAVRKLHDEVLSSCNALNLEKMLSFHTDNIILREQGMSIIKGKQEAIKFLEKFKQQNIVLKLLHNIQEIQVFGERAFVRGLVIKVTIQNDEDSVNVMDKFITLSQKQNNGNWLITHIIINNGMPVEEKIYPHIFQLSAPIQGSLWKS